MKITLKKPIKVDGKDVTELELGELTLGALDDIQFDVSGNGARINLGDISKVISSMANIPPSSAKQIAISDLLQLSDQLQDVLGKFLPTGG